MLCLSSHSNQPMLLSHMLFQLSQQASLWLLSHIRTLLRCLRGLQLLRLEPTYLSHQCHRHLCLRHRVSLLKCRPISLQLRLTCSASERWRSLPPRLSQLCSLRPTSSLHRLLPHSRCLCHHHSHPCTRCHQRQWVCWMASIVEEALVATSTMTMRPTTCTELTKDPTLKIQCILNDRETQLSIDAILREINDAPIINF